MTTSVMVRAALETPASLAPRIRRTLFMQEDGLLVCFCVDALEKRGLLSRLEQRPTTVTELAEVGSCNVAYLHVVLRCLAQAGWLSRQGDPGSMQLLYSITRLGRDHLLHLPQYLAVAEFLARNEPLEASVLSGSPDEPRLDLSRLVDTAIDNWSPAAVRDWGTLEQYRFNVSGPLLVAVMLGLWRLERFDIARHRETHNGARHVARLLEHVGWLDRREGSWSADGLAVRKHVLHYGMVGSYMPMLTRLPRLLYQQMNHATHGTDDSDEQHVDRRLNVLASAHAHQRYFRDADEIIIDIFNRQPLSEQPRFVADSGCGDGSWLKHIYRVVRDQTLRGAQLDQHPLLFVGADYNAAAIDLARQLLTDADVPSLVIFGDISDPDRLARDLRAHGLEAEDGLHIRAFIDHNRVYNAGAALATDCMAFASHASGAYVDERGDLVPNDLLMRDLVVFLRRWVPYVRKHGMAILEAHCVDPRITAAYLGDTHNVVFDTYHALSRQYPVDFNVFMEAAGLAGLTPVLYQQRRYPSRMPFVSISINRFVAKESTASFESVLERRRQAGDATNPPRAPESDRSRPMDHLRLLPRTDANPRAAEWHPEGAYKLDDGEALHRLLYESGDTARPRPWCGPATGVLLRPLLARLERLIHEIETCSRAPSISLLDYGAGTGLFAIELLKAMQDQQLLERIERAGIDFELTLADVPSSWFAKGYELLNGSQYVHFRSLQTSDRRFARLSEVLVRPVDVAIASMVFHLIPAPALPKVFAELARVLRKDGRLLWSAPDIGPARPGSALFHAPNRMLRQCVLQLIDDPSALGTLLARLPYDERARNRDLAAQLQAVRNTQTRELRDLAAGRAKRQILSSATELSTIEASLVGCFDGITYTRSFEMLPREALDTILVPANQRLLLEIADEEFRARLTELVMRHWVLPSFVAGPTRTTDGYSVHWSFGEHTVAA